jgi:hypothetical protein
MPAMGLAIVTRPEASGEPARARPRCFHVLPRDDALLQQRLISRMDTPGRVRTGAGRVHGGPQRRRLTAREDRQRRIRRHTIARRHQHPFHAPGDGRRHRSATTDGRFHPPAQTDLAAAAPAHRNQLDP